MADPNDIDLDELVSQIAPKVAEEIEFDDPEPEDLPFATPEETQEIAGATVQDQLEHLVNDKCDTDACNQLRDEFGITFGDDDEGDESDTEGDESGAEGNDGDGEDEESDSESSSTTNGGESTDTDQDESSDGSDDGPAHAAFPDEF